MKKFVALLLACVMLISFSGCGVNKEMIADLKPIYDEMDYAYQMTRSLADDIRIMSELVEEKGKDITFEDLKGKFAIEEEALIQGVGLLFYDIGLLFEYTDEEAFQMYQWAIEIPDYCIEYLAENDMLSLFDNILISAYAFYIFDENEEMTFDKYLENIEDSYDALSEKYGDDEIYIKFGECIDNITDYYESIGEEEFDSEKYDAFLSKADECYAVFGSYFEE